MSAPFDPNKTQLGSPDPNRTVAMPAGAQDQNRTQAVDISAVGGGQLTFDLHRTREATMANGPAREQYLLNVHAPAHTSLPGVSESGPRTPVNLCLLVDRSASMEGNPMLYAKKAVSYIVDLLTPTDVLSIVTFDTTADVLMPPQQVVDRERIKHGVDQLQVGYTTNLQHGLAMAMEQVLAFKDPGRATRIVVLTDGEPTEGLTDYASLTELAGNIKGRGITSTYLGFGADYSEELLAGMAKRAGGNYYYIPQPEMIQDVFHKELSKLISTNSMNLQMKLKMARWVDLKYATGLSGPARDREVELSFPDLERGSNLELVFDFEFPNHPIGHYRVAAGTLFYDDANTQRRVSVDVDFEMEFTADSQRYSTPQNETVLGAYRVASSSKVVEKTIFGLRTQAIGAQQAMDELHKTQVLLAQHGRTEEAAEVTQAMNALRSGDVGGAEKTLMGTMLHLDQGKTGGDN